MKASEYRIGNWVSNGEDEFQLTSKDIYHLDVYINMVVVKPIPITPEWLERFGFEQYLIGYYRYKKFYISYSNTGLHEYRQRDAYVIFKYVHQLQNLYFALKGEELEIKPNI